MLFDQIRPFDKQRLLRKIGEITEKEKKQVSQMLKKMLAWD
ncbi:MAG: type II toxin-antitoxin system PemK/MazF family toxin [Candidatus Moeniiplasma glomeromycotorum]|nr:type II toxin-antitoxin system PemK/MazF family toxin [Candidatus Moeniiplasma glomeromycotorum]MCE8169419.1 type II toxin-antitoxin system PemK/MazF family toxin [Candidatus Moeniiplasma glomeromycotorum]